MAITKIGPQYAGIIGIAASSRAHRSDNHQVAMYEQTKQDEYLKTSAERLSVELHENHTAYANF